MKQIISANAAAKIIGCPARMVRERLRRGMWTFGKAYPPDEKHSQWTYEINVRLLTKFLKGE